MGRRSKLTPELQDKICNAVRIGATYGVAAGAAGICERTFHNWREWGEERRSGKYVQFLQALRKAESVGEVKHLASITASGAEGSKWILARRHPERWANKSEIKHSGDAENPIVTRVIGGVDLNDV